MIQMKCILIIPAFVNFLVTKDNITNGTSIQGGKMISMNGYSYLHMSTANEAIGWQCARGNENCKAAIHTFKTTGEFSYCNGVFHFHTADLNETRKPKILDKNQKSCS